MAFWIESHGVTKVLVYCTAYLSHGLLKGSCPWYNLSNSHFSGSDSICLSLFLLGTLSHSSPEKLIITSNIGSTAAVHIKDVIIYDFKCVLRSSLEFSNRLHREQPFSTEGLSVMWPSIVAQQQSSRGSPGKICIFTLNHRNQKMQFSTNSPQSRVQTSGLAPRRSLLLFWHFSYSVWHRSAFIKFKSELDLSLFICRVGPVSVLLLP